MTTLAMARKAYRRAMTTKSEADWTALGRVLVPLLSAQPKPRKTSNKWQRGKGVFPAPEMHVEFADGSRWRWSVWQAVGASLPKERARKIACDVYRDVTGREPPAIVVCAKATWPRFGDYLRVTSEHVDRYGATLKLQQQARLAA